MSLASPPPARRLALEAQLKGQEQAHPGAKLGEAIVKADDSSWQQLLASKQHRRTSEAGKYPWLTSSSSLPVEASAPAAGASSVEQLQVQQQAEGTIPEGREEVAWAVVQRLHMLYEDCKLDVLK